MTALDAPRHDQNDAQRSRLLQRGRRSEPVAYLLTHYPKLTHTFIAEEIEELQRLGLSIHPMSMNSCDAEDLNNAHQHVERDRTFYIKEQGAGRALRALIATWRRSPRAVVRGFKRAIRSGGTDIRLTLWRCFHFLEAMLVLEECRRLGVRHLHGQFGLTPATIAWFASELGNDIDGEGWSWSFTIHGFQDFVNEKEAALPEKALSADFVICVSDFTRSQIMRLSHPSTWDKFRVVRCGIDFEKFEFRPSAHTDGPPTILVVARLSAEKGHLILLEALRQLRSRGSTAVVEFVGSGPIEDLIRSEATRLGVADAIRMRGALTPDRIAECLREADVFCLPSFAEGLPVSIMEAMAVGIPVVTTHISGIPELAIDGTTAIVVPAGNAAALAAGLERLLTDDALRRRLVAEARRLVVERHSLSSNARVLIDVFDGVR